MKLLLRVLILILAMPFSVSGGEPLRTDGKIPFRSDVMSGYDEADVRQRCDATDLQPLEGIWYYPDEKITVVIERLAGDVAMNVDADYRAVLVSSSDLSLLPGTVIAYLTQSADKNKFKMWIYSEQCDSVLENPQMCVATLNTGWDELLVERSEVKVRVRVNFSRFLPKLLKGISIVPNKKDVELPEGFRKIYPTGGSGSEREVRYL